MIANAGPDEPWLDQNASDAERSHLVIERIGKSLKGILGRGVVSCVVPW